MLPTTLSISLRVGALMLGFMVVFLGARWGAFAIAKIVADNRPAPASAPEVRQSSDTTVQIVAMTLVGTNCGFSNSDVARDVLNGLRRGLSRIVEARGAELIMIGVDIDADPVRGSALLRRMDAASFDQVVLGGGWDNVLLQNVVWNQAYGDALVPQVIVMQRRVLRTTDPHIIKTLADSHVLSVKGLVELKQWAESGFALPPRLVSPAAEIRAGSARDGNRK
jgi:hypothetical protein